jgi:hypothetical protein
LLRSHFRHYALLVSFVDRYMSLALFLTLSVQLFPQCGAFWDQDEHAIGVSIIRWMMLHSLTAWERSNAYALVAHWLLLGSLGVFYTVGVVL